MTTETSAVPATRRRPRDRKQRILAAAAQRFWTVGYHQVSMAGIAADVGIGASALYRHFRGKQELLLAVLDEQLTALERRTGEAGGDAVAELAAYTVEHREFGVLWEREAGHLPESDRRELRHRLRGLAARVRPDPSAEPDGDAELRAWAILSLLDSPSHHRRPLDPAITRRVLLRAAEAVRGAPLPAPDPSPGPGTDTAPGLAPVSRREALLAVAVRLFAERGYPSVSLDDIGAAAGIAGPSVYNHFTSKIEMLDAALTRGSEALWLGLHGALAGAHDPDEALTRLATDYSGFATTNPHLISVLVSETIHLPGERRVALGRVQRDYVAEWVALVRQSEPGPGPGTDAPVVAVRAALALANSLSRIHHLRVEPGHVRRVAALVRAVLAVDRTPSP